MIVLRSATSMYICDIADEVIPDAVSGPVCRDEDDPAEDLISEILRPFLAEVQG